MADHAGWAVLMTATASGRLLDRRRVELVGEGVPVMPHHHDGQKLLRSGKLPEAVALVGRVRASATETARARLEALARETAVPISGIALRACPPLPETVEERITDYRAMCVADWVMYRQVLAEAARSRGWTVVWYEASDVLGRAARALGEPTLDGRLASMRATLGPPWQKDHKVATAAAIVAANRAATE